MRTTLSARKYKQLALESLRNCLRLLKDAIALYRLGSYPSAFQLGVLSLEEYAKAKWVDDVYYTAITNTGLPTLGHEEQPWLRLLYSHPEKQAAFLWRESLDFSPRLLDAIRGGDLERMKQAATYVGLPKRGKLVDVNARISAPTTIKSAEAKRLISLVVREIKDVYKLIERQDSYFGIETLDDVITSHEAMFVFSWRHPSGLKSRRYRRLHGASRDSSGS